MAVTNQSAMSEVVQQAGVQQALLQLRGCSGWGLKVQPMENYNTVDTCSADSK